MEDDFPKPNPTSPPVRRAKYSAEDITFSGETFSGMCRGCEVSGFNFVGVETAGRRLDSEGGEVLLRMAGAVGVGV